MQVEMIESMGDDLSIVNAARVSYAKESTRTDDGSLSSADIGLINYLMREHHGTPFEMVQFKFRVKCPIGVGREWMRHRIGSFNEVSTRYVEMQPDFYVPESSAVRTQIGRPGHYTFEPIAESEASNITQEFRDFYELAYEQYQRFLEQGVAKELARNVLPLGLMTEFIWSVNLRSLLNFIGLRTAPNALLEIRLLAYEVEQHAATIAPVAMAAWEKCNPAVVA